MPSGSLAMQIPGFFGSMGAGSMGPPPARFPPSSRTPPPATGSAAPWGGPDWPAAGGSAARSLGGGHSLGGFSIYGRSVDMMDVVNNMMDGGEIPASMSGFEPYEPQAMYINFGYKRYCGYTRYLHIYMSWCAGANTFTTACSVHLHVMSRPKDLS